MKIFRWNDNQFGKGSARYPDEIFAPDEVWDEVVCPGCNRNISVNSRASQVKVSNGREWPDFLNGVRPTVVSENVVKAWNAAGIKGFTSYDIEIVVNTKRLPPLPCQYKGLVLERGLLPRLETTTGRCGPTSGVVAPMIEFKDACRLCGRCGPNTDYFILSNLDPDMTTWNGSDLMQWGLSHLFCTERVIEVNLANKFTHFHFRTLDNLDKNITAIPNLYTYRAPRVKTPKRKSGQPKFTSREWGVHLLAFKMSHHQALEAQRKITGYLSNAKAALKWDGCKIPGMVWMNQGPAYDSLFEKPKIIAGSGPFIQILVSEQPTFFSTWRKGMSIRCPQCSKYFDFNTQMPEWEAAVKNVSGPGMLRCAGCQYFDFADKWIYKPAAGWSRFGISVWNSPPLKKATLKKLEALAGAPLNSVRVTP